jgi:hypothetical protein
MRPLAVMLGIVMGSTVSVAVALALTLIVFLALPDQSERLQPELGPLARSLAGAVALAMVSSASFYGELREREWRGPAHAALGVSAMVTVWLAWPR